MEVTVSFFVLKNNSVTKTIPKNIKRCSMKKIMILISVIFLMCTGIWFRFHTKECRVVSDLAYDKNKKGDHLVYIREGHELVPFLVLTSDYNGETLLLRKEVLKMNMQKLSGNGTAFVEIDGHAVEYELDAGQEILISTGYLAAMEETCTMDVVAVKGVKNMLVGGEGVFNTVVRGPGKVILQTMPISKVAELLTPFFTKNK